MSEGPLSEKEPISLLELLVNQRAGWEHGRGLLVEDLLARHPDFQPAREALLALIYNETVLGEECGQTVRPAKYLARFPELAEPLRLQFEVDLAVAADASSMA